MKRLNKHGRVLVIDGAHALILQNEATPPALNLKLERSVTQDNPPTRELGSDVPPRTNDSMGRRSAMETPDYHQMAEDRFVAQLTGEMATDLARGAFQQLVIVAPPVALAAIRKAMTPALAKATILEMDRDLTKHAPKDISQHVAKALEEAAA
jgi:protein required for attachment to host cells